MSRLELIERAYLPPVNHSSERLLLVTLAVMPEVERHRLRTSDLVRITGLSRNTINARFRGLEDAGLLTRHDSPVRYELHLPAKPDDAPAGIEAPKRERRGDHAKFRYTYGATERDEGHQRPREGDRYVRDREQGAAFSGLPGPLLPDFDAFEPPWTQDQLAEGKKRSLAVYRAMYDEMREHETLLGNYATRLMDGHALVLEEKWIINVRQDVIAAAFRRNLNDPPREVKTAAALDASSRRVAAAEPANRAT